MTFKVGDKVITREFSSGGGNPYFADTMLPLVGEQGTILSKNARGWYVRHVDATWTWPESALEKVEEVKRHPFADVIIAWANGAKVQFRIYDPVFSRVWTEWQDTEHPVWSGFGHRAEYRVKPEVKPDVVLYARAVKTAPQSGCLAGGMMHSVRDAGDNVSFTFDGETGKLKAVELLSK